MENNEQPKVYTAEWWGCYDCSKLSGPLQNRPHLASMAPLEGLEYHCKHCNRTFKVIVK